MEREEPIQKRIQDLEHEFKECTTKIHETKIKLDKDKKQLLKCLQKLMPLQNTYLFDIIKTLQAQINDLNKKNSMPLPLKERINNIKNTDTSIIEDKPSKGDAKNEVVETKEKKNSSNGKLDKKEKGNKPDPSPCLEPDTKYPKLDDDIKLEEEEEC